MKGLFLCAFKQRHFNYDIDYNDIVDVPGINIIGDCLKIDLNCYDYLLASPPCNYYSRCNYRRNTSNYAQATKHLLPEILIRFARSGKPFLVENVRAYELFKKEGIIKICSDYNINIYFVGRHTYFTNMFVNLDCPQRFDFTSRGVRLVKNSQGGENTFNVFEIWLKAVL